MKLPLQDQVGQASPELVLVKLQETLQAHMYIQHLLVSR
uniref:Uncharacterized protein n=1 Tax=Arundo donax TaxID=35708 RepID=A0A0A9DHJ0_ARUDO